MVTFGCLEPNTRFKVAGLDFSLYEETQVVMGDRYPEEIITHTLWAERGELSCKVGVFSTAQRARKRARERAAEIEAKFAQAERGELPVEPVQG